MEKAVSLYNITSRFIELFEKAEEGELTPEEMQQQGNELALELKNKSNSLIAYEKTLEAHENALKDEIERLKNEIQDLKVKAASNSLGNIYSANEEISRLAKQEARMIIDDAKKNASRIVNDALLEAEKIELKAETLRRNMVVFKRRMRTIVKSQLETIEDIEDVKLED